MKEIRNEENFRQKTSIGVLPDAGKAVQQSALRPRKLDKEWEKEPLVQSKILIIKVNKVHYFSSLFW